MRLYGESSCLKMADRFLGEFSENIPVCLTVVRHRFLHRTCVFGHLVDSWLRSSSGLGKVRKYSFHLINHFKDNFLKKLTALRRMMGQCVESVLYGGFLQVMHTFQLSRFSRESPSFSLNLPGDFRGFFLDIVFNDILTMQRFLDISRFLYSGGWQIWAMANSSFHGKLFSAILINITAKSLEIDLFSLRS